MLRSSRCTAHNRRGEPCKRWAIAGGTVCPTHGGSIGHVKARAEERLLSLVAPAITELARILSSGETDAVKLAAVKDILDRCGFKPKDVVEAATEVVIRVERVEQPTTYLAQAGHVNGHELYTP